MGEWPHGAGPCLTQRTRVLGRKFFFSLPPYPRSLVSRLLPEGRDRQNPGCLLSTDSPITKGPRLLITHHHGAVQPSIFLTTTRINSICETSLGHLREHHNSFCSPEIVTRTRFCNANCLIFINFTVLHNLPALQQDFPRIKKQVPSMVI